MIVSLPALFWSGIICFASIILLITVRFYLFRNKIRSRAEWVAEIFYVIAGLVFVVEGSLLLQVLNKEIQIRKVVQDDLAVYLKLFDVNTLKLTFAMSVAYIFVMWSIKTAFLCIYWHLYSCITGWRRWYLYATTALVPMTFIASVLAYFLSCRPVSLNWLPFPYDMAPGMNCSATLLQSVQAILVSTNVATDILLIILPLLIMHLLGLSATDIYGILFIFVMVSLCIGSSITRYVVLVRAGAFHEVGGHDESLHFLSLVEMLSMIEVVAGLVAFSLPSFRFAIKRSIFLNARRRLLSWSGSWSSYGEDNKDELELKEKQDDVSVSTFGYEERDDIEANMSGLEVRRRSWV